MEDDHQPPPPPPSAPPFSRFSALLAFQCHPFLVSETSAYGQRAGDKGEVLSSLQWLLFKSLPSLILSELHVLFVREKLICNSQKLAVSLEMSVRYTLVCF